MYQLKLHGIRHFTTERRGEEAAGRPATSAGAAAAAETPWKRRHSLAAAAKNTDWADCYLSTAADDTSLAAFLSVKGDASLDAEYFVCFVPRAVEFQDTLYKQLLAVYNALHYWAGTRDLLRSKRVLVAPTDATAATLLKAAKVNGKLGAAKVLLLAEINDLCRKQHVQMRVPEMDAPYEETVAYTLLRLGASKYKRRFELLLHEQTRLKGEHFIAKERFFPPVYI